MGANIIPISAKPVHEWTPRIVLLWSLCLLSHSSILVESEHHDIGHDQYRTADGTYEWCHFCRQRDLMESVNIQHQCQKQNARPTAILMDADNFSNVLWCYGLGKPPTCTTDGLELPQHIDWTVSDLLHPNFTHTSVTVSCKEGFVRKSLPHEQSVTLACLSSRKWLPSVPKDFECVPANKTTNGGGGVTVIKNVILERHSHPAKESNTVAMGVAIGSAVVIIGVVIVVCVIIYRRGRSPQCSTPKCRNGILKQPPCTVQEPGSKEVSNEEMNVLLDKAVPEPHHPENGELQGSDETGSMANSTISSDSNETIPKLLNTHPPSPASQNILTGNPANCSSPLGALETFDQGSVLEAVVKILDPNNYYGRGKSWVALAKKNGYCERDVIYIEDKLSKNMNFGPTQEVLKHMAEKGNTVGHFLKHLHGMGHNSLITMVLRFHHDCPYCKHFIHV